MIGNAETESKKEYDSFLLPPESKCGYTLDTRGTVTATSETRDRERIARSHANDIYNA